MRSYAVRQRLHHAFIQRLESLGLSDSAAKALARGGDLRNGARLVGWFLLSHLRTWVESWILEFT